MTTVLNASDSAQFLGIVPTLAGFTPRRSIVLLPFRGSRTDGAMRLDPPDDAMPPGRYAASAVRLLQRVRGTDGAAVVVYTDEESVTTADGLVLPGAVVVDHLLAGLRGAGMRVMDALCVTPGGWSSYLDRKPTLKPLAEIGPTPAHPSIGDVSGDQLAGARVPRVGAPERQRVERALTGLRGALDGKGRVSGREDPQALAALALLDDLPGLFEAVLKGPDTIPPFAWAALLWCLQRPALRDAALAQWASDREGGIRALQAQLAFTASGSPIPDELGRVFVGRGPAPDPNRLRSALQVVRHAAARAPRTARPAPLTAAAWLSWALGRATHAGRYVELARDIDREYSLAMLLERLIAEEALPDWAFRGRTRR
ncbi:MULTISPECIES: DUF4192 family protein [unclassified Microbacterium]|uniref:DUF4192 family protein n=1 Tax=unclassified Microbacterium TaxID=2609290 RepID=UPI00109BF51E|nr:MULTISPECIES: DUF4192 family protein [unclassified Microbacterium]